MTIQRRVQSGVPTGGQFTTKGHDEPAVSIGPDEDQSGVRKTSTIGQTVWQMASRIHPTDSFIDDVGTQWTRIESGPSVVYRSDQRALCATIDPNTGNWSVRDKRSGLNVVIEGSVSSLSRRRTVMLALFGIRDSSSRLSRATSQGTSLDSNSDSVDWMKEDATAEDELASIQFDRDSSVESTIRSEMKSMRLAARSIKLQFPDAKYLRAHASDEGYHLVFSDVIDADGNELGLDPYEPLANGVDLDQVGHNIEAHLGDQPGSGAWWDEMRVRNVGGKVPEDLMWAAYIDLDRAAALTDDEVKGKA